MSESFKIQLQELREKIDDILTKTSGEVKRGMSDLGDMSGMSEQTSKFASDLKEIAKPKISRMNNFYITMKKQLISIPIIIFLLLIYFKPKSILKIKDKKLVVDMKKLIKYTLFTSIIMTLLLYYYFTKY